MKKLMALLILSAGLFSLNIDASSCCEKSKECNPAQCCPAELDCCQEAKNDETTVLDHSLQANDPKASVNTKQAMLKEVETSVKED